MRSVAFSFLAIVLSACSVTVPPDPDPTPAPAPVVTSPATPTTTPDAGAAASTLSAADAASRIALALCSREVACFPGLDVDACVSSQTPNVQASFSQATCSAAGVSQCQSDAAAIVCPASTDQFMPPASCDCM
jgi:hypothetical protein